jgi:hypothetical protein
MNNKHKRFLARTLFAIALLTILRNAQAAGGHHGVDDASILGPGECQIEVWAERSPSHRLAHAGPGCRLGPVEAGIGIDRRTDTGSVTQTLCSPQLKWATPLTAELAVGAVWTLSWQQPAPRQTARSLLLPVTWQPKPSLALHLNLGRDFPSDANRVTRRGAAVEWQAHPRWQGLAEWFEDGQRGNRRLGLRHSWSEQVSLDLSRADAVSRPRNLWWTLGVSWTFGRAPS